MWFLGFISGAASFAAIVMVLVMIARKQRSQSIDSLLPKVGPFTMPSANDRRWCRQPPTSDNTEEYRLGPVSVCRTDRSCPDVYVNSVPLRDTWKHRPQRRIYDEMAESYAQAVCKTYVSNHPDELKTDQSEVERKIHNALKTLRGSLAYEEIMTRGAALRKVSG
jgi:hypothetical protein